MRTRGIGIDFFALNDGFDITSEASQATDSQSINDAIDPRLSIENQSNQSHSQSQAFQSPLSESAANSLAEFNTSDSPFPATPHSTVHSLSNRSQPTTPNTINNQGQKGWFWSYFDQYKVDRDWLKNGKKRMLRDIDICCSLNDPSTNQKCLWKTSDSRRHGSTTNMVQHLEKKHNLHPPDRKARQKQPMIQSLLKQQPDRTKSIQEQMESNILRWIVMEKLPFTTLESEAFQSIFVGIPGFTFPSFSRQVLKGRLIKEFGLQRDQLKEHLKTSCKTLALSLDLWTSKNNIPILGMIGHWLTESFEYRERVLEFKDLPGPHSGENLTSAIEDTLIELDIECKVIAITGDNASNNKKMGSLLSQRLREKHGDNTLFHDLDHFIRCLAHILNLIVKDILCRLKTGTVQEADTICNNFCEEDVEIQEPLAKLRILALWIQKSPSQRHAWQETCETFNQSSKMIQYDIDTRWNSTFHMLNDARQARFQIDRFTTLSEDFPCFTPKDWSRLDQLHCLLEPFNQFTLLVSEQRPQLNLVVPIFYALHDLIDEASECKNRFKDLDKDISLAVAGSSKKYEKYYSLVDDCNIYYTAHLLDPRFKGDLLRQELKDSATAELIINDVHNTLHTAYPAGEIEVDYSIRQSLLTSKTASSTGSGLLKRLQPEPQPQMSDIDRYFSLPHVNEDNTEDTNWLYNWWRANRADYPRMAAAARDYLAIPASEVSVERLFSKGRDVISIRRHSMTADTMRMLMLMDNAYRE